jgi:hypothetical protein
LLGNERNLFDDLCPIMAKTRHGDNPADCGCLATSTDTLACKNPHFLHVVYESVGEFERMYRLLIGGAKKHHVTLIAVALFAIVTVGLGFLGSPPQVARDFEECVEQVEARAPSSEGRGTLLMGCGARFAGRRKAGGGYAYYDFMQGRSFDIAGPNPTAEERKQIDREYIGFLDAQRREAISAAFAKRQNEQLRADMESSRQPVGPPIVLTPKTPPSAAAKKPIDRSNYTRCEDGSLSCSWAKFSAVVKNAFASSAKTKP